MLIVGGDMRNAYLARLAAREMPDVEAIGFEKLPSLAGVRRCTVEDATPASCVVMAFPEAVHAGSVVAPYGMAIEACRVLPLLAPGCEVWAGRMDADFRDAVQALGCVLRDPNARATFALANAVPTAEGAIHAAMMRAPFCLAGSACGIVGFGRIGQTLARMLHGLGACVTVAARRAESRALARTMGFSAWNTTELAEHAGDMRVWFSTVPARIVTREVLARMQPDALVIDLASAPYGVDLEAANALGVEAWREGGLPGRFAPETAAAILWAQIRGGEDV